MFKKRLSRKIFLIIVSYAFYAVWDWRLCFLLLASSVLNWAFACGVSLGAAQLGAESLKGVGSKVRGARRVALVFAVITNIAILGFFKYYDFFADSFNVVMFHYFGDGFTNLLPILHVILPVGISFYTFKGLSLVFDAADQTLFVGYGNYSQMSTLFTETANSKRAALSSTRGFIDTLVYISFFPQVASGPITHAAQFYQDLDTATESTTIDFSTASALIMSGLLKKLVFANYLSTLLVNPVFVDLPTYTGSMALLAAIGYSSVIYCDFSGYSDMAIGIALLLGFTTPKNFDRPYISCSVGDFWRRWHITFSTWLKKYLYFKLGGSRHGLARTVLALAITFILSGLWHGAHWMFVLWGAMQGVALIIEHCAKYGKKPASNSFDHALQVIVTFAFTTISWVVFRAANFKEVVAWWHALLQSPHGFFGTSSTESILSPLVITLLALSLAMHLVPAKVRADGLSIWEATPLVIKSIFIAVFFIILSVFGMSSVAPFIYFSF